MRACVSPSTAAILAVILIIVIVKNKRGGSSQTPSPDSLHPVLYHTVQYMVTLH